MLRFARGSWHSLPCLNSSPDGTCPSTSSYGERAAIFLLFKGTVGVYRTFRRTLLVVKMKNTDGRSNRTPSRRKRIARQILPEQPTSFVRA